MSQYWSIGNVAKHWSDNAGIWFGYWIWAGYWAFCWSILINIDQCWQLDSIIKMLINIDQYWLSVNSALHSHGARVTFGAVNRFLTNGLGHWAAGYDMTPMKQHTYPANHADVKKVRNSVWISSAQRITFPVHIFRQYRHICWLCGHWCTRYTTNWDTQYALMTQSRCSMIVTACVRASRTGSLTSITSTK